MKPSPSAREWWGKRRLFYNAGLVAAGMASLTLHAALLELTNCRMEETGLEPLALVYRALGYAGFMVLANLCYSAAPALESRLKPAGPERFRFWTFSLGLAISCALPFAAPLLFLARCP